MFENKKNYTYSLLLLMIMTAACSKDAKSPISKKYLQGEAIYRKENETSFAIAPLQMLPQPTYAWSTDVGLSSITKHHFRCKGISSYEPKICMRQNQQELIYDCEGALGHSLPIKDHEEFIYPILIDLLNFLQKATKKKVIITSGHRCTQHHAYITCELPASFPSKHMMGAEVSFYVEGLEEQPAEVVALLQRYYQLNPQYKDQNQYLEFKRWERATDVTTLPWYNKEIFIKLFKSDEGRNSDNAHAFPYLSIQVRYDKALDRKVLFSWEACQKLWYK